MTKISQREARRLRKRVQELEQRDRRRREMLTEPYRGRHFWTLRLGMDSMAALRTAHTLRHAIVLVPDSTGDAARVYGMEVERAEE